MINGLLGKKIGMTQIFKDTGEVVPVTVIEAGPCVVLQIKSPQTDGYAAVQLGFDNRKETRTNRPQMGRFKKINVAPIRFIKEIRTGNLQDLKVADRITVDIFTAGGYVDITGTSIGKGFQGGVKRWHWKGGPKTHGSTSHRAPGSIGASSDPSRVFKGQHLPGQMGNRRVTVQGLEVVEVDKENNLILVKGAVPGPKGNYLLIREALKKKRKEPQPQAKPPKPEKAAKPAKAAKPEKTAKPEDKSAEKAKPKTKGK